MKWINIVYILLLLYIISAISFWYHSLQVQSEQIATLEERIVRHEQSKLVESSTLKSTIKAIKAKKNNRSRQYIGEGATFLIIIMFGAAIVYSSVKRQRKVSKLQKNFILSVTHELKSPIAGIKLNLQTLNRKKIPEDKRELLLKRAIAESDRLNDLCSNLLLAAQIEGKGDSFDFQKIELNQLILDSVQTLSERYNRTITTQIQDKGAILGDIQLWRLAINNLVENAIKYSEPSTDIAISLHKQEQDVVFKVIDSGFGISEEDKQKVFEKFYRAGDENSRKTKGTGLGLFLTAEIIKHHKGFISVKNNSPKGTIFEVTIESFKS